MQGDIFSLILDKLPRNTTCTFSGFCECFLNTKCATFIKEAYNKGFEVVLYSTLIGFTLEDTYLLKGIKYKHCTIHAPDSTNFIYDYQKWWKQYQLFVGMGVPHNLMALGPTQIPGVKLFDAHSRAGEAFTEQTYKSEPLECPICGNHQLNNNIVLPNGDLILCCMDYSLSYKLGNLCNQTWDYIHSLDNPLFERVINKMNEMDNDLICRKCFNSKQVK
jgi:hypothetical protein